MCGKLSGGSLFAFSGTFLPSCNNRGISCQVLVLTKTHGNVLRILLKQENGRCISLFGGKYNLLMYVNLVRFYV